MMRSTEHQSLIDQLVQRGGIDGGVINDYPVNECFSDQKCNIDEILGVKMLWEKKPANLSDKSSVLQFVSTFFNQIKANLFENRPTKPIPNEVVCVSKVFSSQDWINWVKDENYRRELVLRGDTYANVFLSYRRNFRESHPHPIKTEAISPNRVISLPVNDNDNEAPSPASDPPVTVVTTDNNEIFEIHNNNDMTMM
jgi:hypothetical protein